jgi:hypothetical protein
MKLLRAVARVVFWRYPRGSWQYDILCALILVFIFLTPKHFFGGKVFMMEEDLQQEEEQRVLDSPQDEAVIDNLVDER